VIEAIAIRSTAASSRLPAFTLMLGNFVTGISILAPPGMLADLASGLSVTISDAGLLVTFGAIILCFGSPLMAWATSALDRRLLLSVTVAVLALGNVVSAFAPNYSTLLGVRLVMLSVAAIYTPQAASTISLIVPEKNRASAISFVFLGWSLAVAGGLPMLTFLADNVGWRAGYGSVAVLAAIALALHIPALPSGLRTTALSLKSWGAIAHDRLIVLLLAITTAWVSGQFMIFPYLGPLLAKLGGASPSIIAGFFSLLGVTAFVGNVIATNLVNRIGAFRTSLIFMLSLLVGMSIWSVGAGSLLIMGIGLSFLGLGFAALNSMQQARLTAAAPALASATVALNTSVLYVGQAIGSGIGGFMFAHALAVGMGYVGSMFMLMALGILLATRPKPAVTASA
jgi:DHA1 family inner membrane transport protein